MKKFEVADDDDEKNLWTNNKILNLCKLGKVKTFTQVEKEKKRERKSWSKVRRTAIA